MQRCRQPEGLAGGFPLAIYFLLPFNVGQRLFQASEGALPTPGNRFGQY